jgi:hypothetical protein
MNPWPGRQPGVAAEEAPLDALALCAGLSEEAVTPDEWLEWEPPPRKSVSYQPEPLSRKPAAVTCFS